VSCGGALTHFPCKLGLKKIFSPAWGVQVHPLHPLATPMVSGLEYRRRNSASKCCMRLGEVNLDDAMLRFTLAIFDKTFSTFHVTFIINVQINQIKSNLFASTKYKRKTVEKHKVNTNKINDIQTMNASRTQC